MHAYFITLAAVVGTAVGVTIIAACAFAAYGMWKAVREDLGW